MTVTYEERASDSPFVESIWHTHAERDGCDIVSADVSWDMIIARKNGKPHLSVWGPMTKAVPIPHAEGEEYLGIRFKLGAFMPLLSADSLLNSGLTLPDVTGKSFWLDGSSWEYPSYENVETFIKRLANADLLNRDDIVEAALEGDPQYMSLRSVQRRFLRITGLSQRHIRSIERARQAASLLENGTSILDTVYQAGYADQQSLTKSLKRFLGRTPAQIARTHQVQEIVVSGQDFDLHLA